MRSSSRQHSPCSPVSHRLILATLIWLILALLAARTASGQVAPTYDGDLAGRAVRDPSLFIPLHLDAPEDLTSVERQAVTQRLAVQDPAPVAAFLDRRGGRWATVVTSVPLVPGSGVGNDLRKGRYPADAKGSKVAAVLRAVADDLDA